MESQPYYLRGDRHLGIVRSSIALLPMAGNCWTRITGYVTAPDSIWQYVVSQICSKHIVLIAIGLSVLVINCSAAGRYQVQVFV